MVNETVMAAVNDTSLAKEVGAGLSYFFKDLLLPRFLEVLDAPIKHPQMLWMTIPLAATLFLMMFYFSRFKKEELGWNTAIGNSLVLIFVGMDLMRNLAASGAFQLVNLGSLTSNIKILIALCILAEGVLLLLVEFNHTLPKRLAYFVSSPIYVNVTAYMGLVVVYSDVPIDLITLIAAVVLLICLYVLFFLLYKIVPESGRELRELEEKEKRTEKAEKKSKKSKKDDEEGWVEIKPKHERLDDEEDEKEDEKKDKGFLYGMKKGK